MEYTAKRVTLKNGKTCVIRRPETEDAERLLRYQKETSGETPYLVTAPEDIDWTVEEQAGRLKRWNAAPDKLRLISEVDGALAGAAIMYGTGGQSRLRHRCGVDITLYRKFWGMGIGTALLGELLAAAKAAGYEQAELDVVSANTPAIGLYRKLGFEVVGAIPRALKYRDGSCVDFLLMAKSLGRDYA